VKTSFPFFDQEEIDSVAGTLRSGQWSAGQQVRMLEREFSLMVGGVSAVAVSSGTAALWVALAALGIGTGDEVMVPAFSFVASANCVLYTGARPVFVDVDDNGNMSPASLERAVRTCETPRAVIVVHLYGLPADMGSLLDIAREHGLYVVEDCAQSLGARWGGLPVGTLGDAGCFSFYSTKNVACGEGGMVVTGHPEVEERARGFINHGQSERYHHVSLGYNLRLSDIHAAIARVQLCRLPECLARRTSIAAYYQGAIVTPSVTKPPSDPGHAWNLYTVRCVGSREAFTRHLASLGIPYGIHYPQTIPAQPFYRRLGYGEEGLPVSCQLAKEVVSLPMHPGLTGEECRRVASAVEGFRP
jgi:dTDP-4-amino-4,6-dideoxygalactose transaminase